MQRFPFFWLHNKTIFFKKKIRQSQRHLQQQKFCPRESHERRDEREAPATREGTKETTRALKVSGRGGSCPPQRPSAHRAPAQQRVVKVSQHHCPRVFACDARGDARGHASAFATPCAVCPANAICYLDAPAILTRLLAWPAQLRHASRQTCSKTSGTMTSCLPPRNLTIG